MGDTLRLTPSESVTIRRSEPEVLEVEGVYGPGGSPPPKHLHPAQDEHFELLAGELSSKVDGVSRELRAGDTLEIPRGAVHQMWNPGGAEARVRWRTMPAGRTEEWFRAVDRLHAGAGGKEPSPLAFGPLLTGFSDTFQLAVAPKLLRRPLTAVLGALGRARGYRAA